jgi:hypothetical protein
MRTELKDQIGSFLESAQEIERMAGDPDQFDYATRNKASHELWTQYQRLALICPAELSNPLDRLAGLLDETLWHGTPEGVRVWEHVRDARWRFRDVAQREIQWIEE